MEDNHRMYLHDTVCNLEFVPQIMSLLQTGIKANIELARALLPLVGEELNGYELTEFEFLHQIGWSSFLYFDFDQIPKEKSFDVLGLVSKYTHHWAATALEKTPEYMSKCMPILPQTHKFELRYVKNTLHKKLYDKPLYLGWIADKFPNLEWFEIGNDDVSGIDFSFLSKLKSLFFIKLDNCSGIDLDEFSKILDQLPNVKVFSWYCDQTYAYEGIRKSIYLPAPEPYDPQDVGYKKYKDFVSKYKDIISDF
jgi:hypothetical protein